MGVPMVVGLRMAAQVGFPGLKVTDDSHGWFLWFLWLLGCGWLPRYGFPASKLRAVPMDASQVSYGCWVADGCQGRVSRPQSFGRFQWMVPMVPMVVGLRVAAQVGFPGLKVTDGSYGWFLWF